MYGFIHYGKDTIGDKTREYAGKDVQFCPMTEMAPSQLSHSPTAAQVNSFEVQI